MCSRTRTPTHPHAATTTNLRVHPHTPARNQVLENLFQITGDGHTESTKVLYELLKHLILVPHPTAPDGMITVRLRALLMPESNQSYNFFEVCARRSVACSPRDVTFPLCTSLSFLLNPQRSRRSHLLYLFLV